MDAASQLTDAAAGLAAVIDVKLTQRRDHWLAVLTGHLANHVDLTTLDAAASNTATSEALTEASLIAIGSPAKQSYILEASTRIVSQSGPVAEQHLFLALIDKLTPPHLRLLNVLASPYRHLGVSDGHTADPEVGVVAAAGTDPDLHSLLPMLLLDLHTEGLTVVADPRTPLPSSLVAEGCLTSRGNMFSAFVHGTSTP